MKTKKIVRLNEALVQQGLLSKTKPILPSKKKFLVAVQTTPPLGSRQTGTNPWTSASFLYPAMRKLEALSFTSLDELIKKRKSLLRTRPQSAGYLAVFDEKMTAPVLSIVITHGPLCSVESYKQKHGKNKAQITLDGLTLKGFSTDNPDALIVNVKISRGKEAIRIFNFNDNAVIIDQKTSAILYAGKKAIKLCPALAAMSVHKEPQLSRAQIIKNCAHRFRTMKQQQTPAL